MNKQRKNAIKTELDHLRGLKKSIRTEEVTAEIVGQELQAIRNRIASIHEEEQSAYEQMSEKQQCSEQGEIAEECMALLEDALDYMSELIADLGDPEIALKEIGWSMEDVIELLEDIGRM